MVHRKRDNNIFPREPAHTLLLACGNFSFPYVPCWSSIAALLQDQDREPRTAGAHGDGSLPACSVPPPPPPPLPQPVAEDAQYTLVAPRSPYITSGDDPILGHLLLDFLHLFGEDFDVAREGLSVRGGGFRFRCHDKPPHPQAGDPIVIEVRIGVYRFVQKREVNACPI